MTTNSETRSHNQLAALRTLESLGAATYTQWRDAAEDIPRGSFGRVVRVLVERNAVTEVEGLYRPASAETDADTTATDTSVSDEARLSLLARKKRVSEASRTYAYSAAHGGMRPYSEIRAAKGYTQTDTD
jgi:hypothetical protein